MTLTLAEAKALGWRFEDAAGDDYEGGECVRVFKDDADAPTIVVTSATPLFYALRDIAEAESLDFPAAATAETVAAATGETLPPPTPPTPEQKQRAQAEANATTLRQKAEQALANLEAAGANWGTLTNAQKDAANRLAVQTVARLVRLRLDKLDAAP